MTPARTFSYDFILKGSAMSNSHHGDFKKLTHDYLDDLYTEWCRKDTEESIHLRFGQFVYNRTGVEVENSYNIVDPQKAYEVLQAVFL